MMISTKGRYALRVMLDLAEHNNGSYIPLKEVARRQNISIKYMENIVACLSRGGLLDASRGKGGGYRLDRPLDQYTAGDIIRLAEGKSLSVVACMNGFQAGCDPDEGHCAGMTLWQGLDEVVFKYLDSVTLADLQTMGPV